MSKKRNNKKPWPTKDAMTQIYTNKLWGDNNSDFYSGSGSHNPTLVYPYLEAVTTFLTSFQNQITVCDLGCGDFNIGKQLVKFTKKYIGIDIVDPLIERNKQQFQQENLEFLCLDIAKDTLPKVDCIILRQVLQHLSNTEIQAILDKLKNYKYIILTEHVPEGIFEPNKDIISGQGIRIKKQSGVNILAAPFNFKVKREKQLLSIKLPENKGVIITKLFEVVN